MVALFRKNKRNKHNRDNSNDWKTDKITSIHNVDAEDEALLQNQVKDLQAAMDAAQRRLAKVKKDKGNNAEEQQEFHAHDLLVYPQGGEDHDVSNQKSILTPPSSFKMQVDTDNEYVPRTKKKKKSGLRKALRRTAALGPQVLLQIKKSKFLLKPTKTKYSRMTLMTAIRQRFWNVKTKTPQAEEEAASPAAREQRRNTSSPKYQVTVNSSTPSQEYQQPPVMEIMVPPEVEKSVCSSENSGKFRRELKNALQARSGGDGSNNDFPSDEDNYDEQYGHHFYNSGVCDDDISSVSWNRTWAGREDILIPPTLTNTETGTENTDPVDPTPDTDPSNPPPGAPAGSWTKVINNNTKLMTTIKEQEQELLPLPAPQEEGSPQRSCAVVRNNTRALVERLEKKNHTVRPPPPKMTSPRRSFEYSRLPQATVEKTSTTSKEDASLNKPTPPPPTMAPAKTMWSPKGSKKESDDHSVATTFSKELARKISNLKKSATAAARVKTTTPPRSSFDSSTSELTEARNGLRPTSTASSKTANKKFEYSKSPPAQKVEGGAMKKQKTTTSVPPLKKNSDSARISAESFSQAIARQRDVLKATTSKTTVPSAKVDTACTSQPTLPSRPTSSKKTFAAKASPFGKQKADVDPNTPPADDATIVSSRSGRSAFRRELSAKFGAMFQKHAAATRAADNGKKEAEQPQPKQAPPPPQQEEERPQQIQRSSSRRKLRPQDLLKQKSIVRKWDKFAVMEDNGTPAAPRRRTDVFASKKKTKVVSSPGPPAAAAARPQDKRANLLADIRNPTNALKATPASAGGNPKSAPSSKKVPPAPKEVKSRPKGNLMSEIMNKKLKPVSASSGNVRMQHHKQQQRRNTAASRPAASPPSSGNIPKGNPHPMMAAAALKNDIGKSTATPNKGDLMAGIRAGVKLNKVASPDKKKAGVVGKSAGSRGHPAQASSTARAPISSSSSSPHMAALMAKLQSRKEKCL